ncbi:MAG: hypothetical protein J0J04_08290 [Microbacterium sp.]|uniref:hypothetical protein n=1 Tax=Microbacterium sp. TaxID=51671 RepID=UPI001ACE3E97|nr:hypothetical protein [Microbacterium sp.]MBN9214800.1 hypothetical protein [Microbacterium sp.]
MTFVESEHPRARAGQFTDKHNDAPAGALTAARDLTAETPVAIDEELAELYYERAKLSHEIDRFEAEITRYEKYIEREARFPHRVADYERTIDRYQDEIATRQSRIAEIVAAELPLEGEYRRRGTWPRAFLVSGGHLHSSMNCSTCNREGKLTRFAWMTDYSGATEEEIVEAAASRACTTCFPSAPVDVLGRPSTLLTPDEEQQAADRAAREAEKERKAVEKAAKAITNPDGTELREPRKYGQVVRTLVTAERELVGALVDLGIADHRGGSRQEYLDEKKVWADLLVEAIAAKKGISVKDAYDEASAKAAKKVASTLRAWG